MIMIFPGPSLRHKNKSEMTGDCYFFNMSGLLRTELKHLMRFQSETSVYKFIWRSADTAHVFNLV